MLRNAVLAVVLLAFTACGEPTKQEILGKAENVSTKAELVKALGEPDDISKLGPVESWTYKASNGEVVFVITGDSVALGAAGGSGDEK
jgi:hypothetical protein